MEPGAFGAGRDPSLFLRPGALTGIWGAARMRAAGSAEDQGFVAGTEPGFVTIFDVSIFGDATGFVGLVGVEGFGLVDFCPGMESCGEPHRRASVSDNPPPFQETLLLLELFQRTSLQGDELCSDNQSNPS
jgi:hypothetical protein